MRSLAARLRLVVHQPRGEAGTQMGRGWGSSVEVQDHRPFVLGDDPRHIDWNAYGRTGQWIAKTFRPEVRPSVDLVMDGSSSMCVFEPKRARALELFYLVVEGARGAGAALQVHTVVGDAVQRVALDALDAGAWSAGLGAGPSGVTPELAKVPWRQGALRVWVSDLLYPGTPKHLTRALLQGAGRAIILAPFAQAEAEPSWSGNLTLVDAETARERVQLLSEATMARYREAYARHFLAYQEHGHALGLRVVRVGDEAPLEATLMHHAVPAGVFEAWA